MNAVEIEEAISALAEQRFDAQEFPFAFLEAFGNKEATIKRLRAGATNKSDIGGVLQTNNIHIKTCGPGEVTQTLAALKASPATAKGKVKFTLATDGDAFEAEDVETGETVACAYADFPDHFGFFLPLAGISTVKQLRDSSFDIRATSRLNRLYRTLLEENPDWDVAERRPDMNHFMARLIFCFFAEDTDIFNGTGLFTATIEQMSAKDSSNTDYVIGEIFRAMNVRIADRESAKLPRWADVFPYVNGGLFSGRMDVPRFSKIARSYLLHIGNLDWTKINPDIFGSMIQAVADDEERGALGMHYTSVPNILKVLNPLFLDDLREKLEEAGDNKVKLLNLRKRMSRIRVFDPACGSGNFLVIAYKQMREIEAEINIRRGETERKSEIPLTNFRGIELRDFPAEIARLALIIAEYQCDVLYRGQKLALAEFLPLDAQNWITCGNALRLDWLSICPPTGTGVKLHGDDLFNTPLDQPQIDFENEGGETYICGNPPYQGVKYQSADQRSDLEAVCGGRIQNWKSLDYVAGWFLKAAEYGTKTRADAAFVSTNSICQGQQVAILWKKVFETGHYIHFAYTSFRWANLATHNAGVTVVIVGISNQSRTTCRLYSQEIDGENRVREVSNINGYLGAGADIFIEKRRTPISDVPEMEYGSMPNDGGHLILSPEQLDRLGLSDEQRSLFVRRLSGAEDLIRGNTRYCLWIDDQQLSEASRIPEIRRRIDLTRDVRLQSARPATVKLASMPHRFGEVRSLGRHHTIAVPITFSESREYLTVVVVPGGTVISVTAFAMHDRPLWNLGILSSKLFLVWVAAVGGRLKTDFRITNTVVWNTFPLPTLTEKNKADLTRCAQDILLAREAHFPKSIADLYGPDEMPADLREVHERNDEVLERVYIGRRFKNDTERLEKLFELYTKMTTASGKMHKVRKAAT